MNPLVSARFPAPRPAPETCALLRDVVRAYSAGHPWPTGDHLSQPPLSTTSTRNAASTATPDKTPAQEHREEAWACAGSPELAACDSGLGSRWLALRGMQQHVRLSRPLGFTPKCRGVPDNTRHRNADLGAPGGSGSTRRCATHRQGTEWRRLAHESQRSARGRGCPAGLIRRCLGRRAAAQRDERPSPRAHPCERRYAPIHPPHWADGLGSGRSRIGMLCRNPSRVQTATISPSAVKSTLSTVTQKPRISVSNGIAR